MFGLFNQSSANTMTVHQAQEAGAVIVDIRSPAEWMQTGVLPGARLITFGNAASFVAALRPHLKPGKPVALICASGARTAQAQKMLEGKLDVPIINIKGGMMAALRAAQPVTRPTRAAGCATC